MLERKIDRVKGLCVGLAVAVVAVIGVGVSATASDATVHVATSVPAPPFVFIQSGWDAFSPAYDSISVQHDDTTGIVTEEGMLKTTGTNTLAANVSTQLTTRAAPPGVPDPLANKDGLRAMGSGEAKIGSAIVPILVFIDNGCLYVQSSVGGAVTWLSYSATYQGT